MANPSRRSYAGTDPDLRRDLPDSLREAGPITPGFEDARDPLYRANQRALRMTEAQRREEQDSGSLMVKLHKPLPSLRPRNHQPVLRSHFNQDWLKEQRRAALSQFEAERQASEPSPVVNRATPSPSR